MRTIPSQWGMVLFLPCHGNSIVPDVEGYLPGFIYTLQAVAVRLRWLCKYGLFLLWGGDFGGGGGSFFFEPYFNDSGLTITHLQRLSRLDAMS
jgi:hypothetical protein